MPESFRIQQMRRQKSMDGKTFQKSTGEFFKKGYKAEKIAKALNRSGHSLRGKSIFKKKMGELFKEAEGQGLKMTKSGRKMSESLEGKGRLADRMLDKEVKRQIALEKGSGLSPKEEKKQKKREEMTKKMHQRERADEVAKEESSKKTEEKSESRDSKSSAYQATSTGGVVLPIRQKEQVVNNQGYETMRAKSTQGAEVEVRPSQSEDSPELDDMMID